MATREQRCLEMPAAMRRGLHVPMNRRTTAAWMMTLGLMPAWRAAHAQSDWLVGRSPQLVAAVQAFTGGAVVVTQGVKLRVPELVETGNGVPIEVHVDSPMTERDHVTRIALFSEHNPISEMAVFELGPLNGRARIATRVRLSTTQHVLALARTSTGRFHGAATAVLVTLAACVEE